MKDYQKYINALRKCAKEHENDSTFTGHIIVSDLCRDTANLLEALEQEPDLDKIKAEIESYKLSEDELSDMDEDSVKWGMKIAYDIVDNAESEIED